MASIQSSGPTLDELLQFISQTVVDHFTDTKQRTNGAYLAEAIRARWAGFNYELVGLTRLSDAIRMAEERELIVRHRDVKHLELSPGPATGLTKSLELTATPSYKPQYVRPDIWRAFALITPGQSNYLDTANTQVVSRPASSQPPTDDQNADRFILIEPVPLEDQRRWMREYVESKESLSIFDAPINDQQCYIRFPEWLQTISPEYAKDWRQFRTRCVVEFVKNWASQHSVQSDDFFVRAGSQREPAEKTLQQQRGDDSAREAIIAAVREMPLEDLERLAIPLRYVLRHFKPR